MILATISFLPLNHVAEAQVQVNSTLQSFGTITQVTDPTTPTATPTLTPTPTPTDIPTPTVSTNPTPTSAPTPTTTPTQTPTQPSTISTTGAGIWLHSEDVSSINYNTLTNAGISEVYILTASWNSNHGLDVLMSDSQIATLLSNAHSRGINVHAWTIRFWGNGEPALDISSSSARSSCVSAVVSLMTKSFGGQTFDGHNDDLAEHFSGSWANYAAYLSAVTTQLNNLGKISSTDMLVWTGYPVESVFPQLNCNYICGMFYSDKTWSQSDFYATVSRAIQYSPVSIKIGLYYDSRIGPYSPASQLTYAANAVDESNSKFNGYILYCGDESGWNYIDWTSWNNWR